MMKGTDIKKLASKILRQKNTLRDTTIMHPAREWYIGILVATVILLVTGLWSISVYLENRNAAVTVAEEAGGDFVYREQVVAEALSEFRERAGVVDRLVGNHTTVVEENVPVATSTPNSEQTLVASSTEAVIPTDVTNLSQEVGEVVVE